MFYFVLICFSCKSFNKVYNESGMNVHNLRHIFGNVANRILTLIFLILLL